MAISTTHTNTNPRHTPPSTLSTACCSPASARCGTGTHSHTCRAGNTWHGNPELSRAALLSTRSLPFEPRSTPPHLSLALSLPLCAHAQETAICFESAPSSTETMSIQRQQPHTHTHTHTHLLVAVDAWFTVDPYPRYISFIPLCRHMHSPGTTHRIDWDKKMTTDWDKEKDNFPL
jgi:hypothetical protein